LTDGRMNRFACHRMWWSVYTDRVGAAECLWQLEPGVK
jgi:hypothetical protein